jgi:hypothetical protein
VAISLIYVASEVRMNTRATQLAAMRSINHAFNRWIQRLGQYPHLADVYFRGIYDFESLQPTDFVRFSALLHQAFRLLEEMYYLQARAIWKKVCGMGGKRRRETSMHIPEFRLDGVYACIGPAKSL